MILCVRTFNFSGQIRKGKRRLEFLVKLCTREEECKSRLGNVPEHPRYVPSAKYRTPFLQWDMASWRHKAGKVWIYRRLTE